MFLDHVLVSNAIRQDIVSAEVHDTSVNLSDHIPILYTFQWSLHYSVKQTAVPAKIKQYSWRWDKSDLNLYYHCTNHNLNLVNVPAFNCDINGNVSSHLDAINVYYENIVAVLHSAACTAIHHIPCNTLKPFWNEELDRLKNDSIFWHNLWTDAGKPSSGVVQHAILACKAKYKLAIRNAYTVFENKLSDEMYSHFINKRIPEFWKTWNAKFIKNTSKQVNINGYVNDVDIANEFAAHFKLVFHSSNDSEACNEYLCKRKECVSESTCSSYECIEGFTVELLDKCVRKINLGKACGPDDLCAENLLYSH